MKIKKSSLVGRLWQDDIRYKLSRIHADNKKTNFWQEYGTIMAPPPKKWEASFCIAVAVLSGMVGLAIVVLAIMRLI